MTKLAADGTPSLCIQLDPVPVRRQDTPKTFDMNASLYVWNREVFFKYAAAVISPGTRQYEMPEYTVFDIDSEFDFELVEFLYKRENLGQKNEK